MKNSKTLKCDKCNFDISCQNYKKHYEKCTFIIDRDDHVRHTHEGLGDRGDWHPNQAVPGVVNEVGTGRG